MEDFEKKDRQLENLKNKYSNTESYIENNKENMDSTMLENLNKKQENRKNQIDFLENEE